MKNTGIIILCCIFVVFAIPIRYLKHIEFNEYKNVISVYNTVKDEIIKMSLEDYVVKVLEKEMPSSFEPEALKAQAVAIRTYALRKSGSEAKEHKGADVCTDFKHCMAYEYNEDNIVKEYKDKYKKAVNDTKGEILTYENKLAATFFFALSAGNTQNCKDVWGTDLPYLRSVDSTSDTLQNNYKSEINLSSDEILQKLGVNLLDGYNLEKFESGYVKNLNAGGKTLSGKEVREKLDLKSSCFEITENDNSFIFTVYGNGHGVGMSQYGANEMAKQGKTYRQILEHYYNGTELATK